ncbi:MAG TPA: hypothetical protein PLG60_04680 [Acidimicrobiales bacterium]|nr:hypothetical protein [Acidimicrobiales bacterium]
MKRFVKHGIIAATLVASLGTVAPSVAFASGSSGRAAATTTAWTTFRANWATYVQGIKNINATCRTSVQSAHSTFSAAMSAATTATERQAARTALQAAIEAALSTRVAAITAAGNPPTPPAGFNGTAWVASFQAANVAFRASIATAQRTFVAAMTSATTQSERVAARAALKLAIGNAAVTRSTALAALGAHPTKPGQPTS